MRPHPEVYPPHPGVRYPAPPTGPHRLARAGRPTSHSPPGLHPRGRREGHPVRRRVRPVGRSPPPALPSPPPRPGRPSGIASTPSSPSGGGPSNAAAALHAPLGRRRSARVAIDYHRVPYFGEPNRDTTRAKTTDGTHTSHTYATACAVGGPDRYTLGRRPSGCGRSATGVPVGTPTPTRTGGIALDSNNPPWVARAACPPVERTRADKPPVPPHYQNPERHP